MGDAPRLLEPAAPTVARKVLVVDDNPDAALLLGELLRTVGFEPHIAHDGVKALELAAEHSFHAAVVDIGLPVMDGHEVGRRLLARQSLTLVALTGYGQPSDRQRSAEAGFHHHLVKPVRAEDLFAALE
jgi:CheY-like chemotaxis protein